MSDQSPDLVFSCLTCGKRLACSEKMLRQTTKCPKCNDPILVLPDDHPERKIDVCFSRLDNYAESSINRIKRFIAEAKKTLDIAVYSLTHNWLATDFAQAADRGVKIRIVTDRLQARNKDADGAFYLNHLNIPVRLDRKAGSMHHKFAIRDRTTVVTGSFNWTKAADGPNRENFLFLREWHVVRAFEREFALLWSESSEPREGELAKADPKLVSAREHETANRPQD